MGRITKLKSHRYFVHGAIVAGLVLCFFIYELYVWINTQTTDNAYIEADISNVSPEVNGIICEILVEENSKVQKGQIIAKINEADYRAASEKAISTLETAKRDIEIIEQNIKLAQIDQTKSKEAFDFADANFKLTKADYERTEKLSKDNFASKQKLDSSEIAFEKAKNEFAQAQLNMQTNEEKLSLLEIQRLSAISRYNTIKQETVLTQRALDNTTLRAPIDGTLGNSSLKIGNYVRAGMVLFAVVPDKLYVKANFKETQISKFAPGMKVDISFDSEPDAKITGCIRNVSPATGAKFSLLPPANATGNFTKIVQRVPVTIDFEIPENLLGKLTPGMSTIVKIRTDKESPKV